MYDIPGLCLAEMDQDGRIVSASPALCTLLGRSTAEVVGHRTRDFVHADDVAACCRLMTSLGTGPVACELRCLRPDGEVTPVLVSAVLLRAEGRVLAHVSDLTTIVAARAAQERAALRYAALVAHSADLILVTDAEGRLASANPATVHLVGDRIGQNALSVLHELVHPEDLGVVVEGLARAYAEAGRGQDVSFRLRDRRGEWLSLEASASNQLSDPAVRGIVITVRDVTMAVRLLAQTSATMRSLVVALVRATEFRDPYTAGHELKVAALSRGIAERLGLDEARCTVVELGASVHDIGKIAIPAEILTRPGPLSSLELEMVRSHCRVGYDILAEVDLPAEIADIVLHHHERLDGSGYPDGLAGEAIGPEARIVAVADVIDAMSSHRPYRPALGLDAAMAELQLGRGRRYDAAVVDAAQALVEGQQSGSVSDPLGLAVG